ncbi:hypothetical protein OKZ62_001910 [Vibrio navarrensis]|nr:hypothetical protein [Vibrio navarrensis]
MQSAFEAIYKELDGIYNKAETIYSVWASEVARREVNRNYKEIKNRESTNYELRLEFTGPSFRMRWLEVSFVRNGSKVIRLTKAIKATESGKHKLSQFKNADEWELLLIKRVEDAFGIFRPQVKHLMKAHQSLIMAAKLGNQKIETIEMKDRVESRKRSIKEIKESLRR